MFLSLGVAIAVICFVIDLQSFSCTEAWTGPPSARARRKRRYGKRTMVNLEVLELIHSSPYSSATYVSRVRKKRLEHGESQRLTEF